MWKSWSFCYDSWLNFRCVRVCVVWLIAAAVCSATALLLLLSSVYAEMLWIFHMRFKSNRMLCMCERARVCVGGWVAEGVDTNRIKVVTVYVVCYSLTVIILFCACFQSKLIYVCFQLYLSTYGLMDWWMIWLALLSAKSTKQYKPV